MNKKGQNVNTGLLESFSDNDKLIFARTRIRKACKLILDENYLDRILYSLNKYKMGESLNTSTPNKTQQMISKIKSGILSICGVRNANNGDLTPVCAGDVYEMSIPLTNANLNDSQLNTCVALAKDILTIGIRSSKTDKYKNLNLSVKLDNKAKKIILSFSLKNNAIIP